MRKAPEVGGWGEGFKRKGNAKKLFLIHFNKNKTKRGSNMIQRILPKWLCGQLVPILKDSTLSNGWESVTVLSTRRAKETTQTIYSPNETKLKGGGSGVESSNYCIFTKCKEAEGEMASLLKVNFMVLKEDKRRTGSCPLVCVKCGVNLNEDLPVKEYSYKKKI